MGKIPEDPAERLAWLEQWATEQRERVQDQDPWRVRLKRNVGAMLERQAERLDPVFDRGLDTAGDVFLPRPGTGGLIYVAGPTPWHVLPRALRRIGATDQDVFVELGCGKGRVVHQAARRPLRRVIGVELLPEIADFARGVVAAQRHKHRCPSVEIVTSDAALFQVPDDVTIAYHAYGFGEDTMDAVLRNLIASIDSRPRRVRLIYHWPTRGIAQVLATGRFRPLPELSFGSTAILESCG